MNVSLARCTEIHCSVTVLVAQLKEMPPQI